MANGARGVLNGHRSCLCVLCGIAAVRAVYAVLFAVCLVLERKTYFQDVFEGTRYQCAIYVVCRIRSAVERTQVNSSDDVYSLLVTVTRR